MRVVDGTNPLDKTSIHTESYEVTLKLLEKLGLDVSLICTEKMKERLKRMASCILDIIMWLLITPIFIIAIIASGFKK